jgi:hypothetical protein
MAVSKLNHDTSGVSTFLAAKIEQYGGIGVWSTELPGIENYTADNVEDYRNAVTELGASGVYTVTIPAALPVGYYRITFHGLDTENVLTEADIAGRTFAGEVGYWDGVNWTPVTGDANLIAWKGTAPLDLVSQRVQTQVGSLSADAINAIWNKTVIIVGADGPENITVANLLQRIHEADVAIFAEVDNGDEDATTTQFKTNLTQADGYWDDALLVFTSGSLIGQSKPILSYSNTNGLIVLDEPFTEAPADGNTFDIKIFHTHPKSQIADAVWDEAGSEHVTAGSFGAIVSVVSTTVTAIAAKLAGITLLANWLRAFARSDAADATALSEINDGGGGYDVAEYSQEAIGDTGIEAKNLLEADLYIDTATTPWQLVYILKDSGTLQTGTELLRQEIKDVDGADITATGTTIGQLIG